MNEDEIQGTVKRAVAIVEACDVPSDLRATVFDKVWTALLGEVAGQRRRGKRRSSRATAVPAPETQRADKPRKPSGPKSLVTELVEEGFFGEWRAITDVQEALRVRGHNFRQPALSPALLRLIREKMLERETRSREDGGDMWVYRKRTV